MSAESFILYRFLIGGAILLPVIRIFDLKKDPKTPFFKSFTEPFLLKNGILCGTILFAASYFQQMSLSLGTTGGKCAFLTSLYMIFVPLAGILLGVKIKAMVWIGVALSATGTYFLCAMGETSFAVGDILVLIAALLYTAHILNVDRIVSRVDCTRLACMQFFVAGILGGIVTCFTGFPSVETVRNGMISILYVGIFSSGVAYTLQIVGQKYCPAAIAPLLMSLESVFAALAGWLILSERLTLWQGIGCFLIFSAILLIQIPMPSRKKE